MGFLCVSATDLVGYYNGNSLSDSDLQKAKCFSTKFTKKRRLPGTYPKSAGSTFWRYKIVGIASTEEVASQYELEPPHSADAEKLPTTSPTYCVRRWIWAQFVVFTGRIFSILAKAMPYKDCPMHCEPPPITFIPCEEHFRPVLPTIEGNVDYLALRGQLTTMDELLSYKRRRK